MRGLEVLVLTGVKKPAKKQLTKTVMNELEELGLTWREAQANAQDTIER